MAHSNKAERDANSEEIKEIFSQRSSQMMGIIKHPVNIHSKFIHVGFSSMQQFTISCRKPFIFF
ncbi:MAG: hypothetical protein OEU76_08705, partial [Cyclobacteriaceae bacterium]|nr:hypothetical protein [Cyclobacteriaceae bacterium]